MTRKFNILKEVDTQNLIYYMIEVQNLDYKLVEMLREYWCPFPLSLNGNKMDKEPISLNGLEKLKEELIFLKEKKRPEIVAAIAEARSHGDLKENAEYHAAKEEQSHNEGRITEINDIIARANVIDVTKIAMKVK